MATATASASGALQSGQIALPVGRAAYVKQYWSDDWTLIPYLDPRESSLCAAPSVGEARFEYKYGFIQREGLNAFRQFYPLNISGWYIAIYLYDYYGSAVPFVGVVDFEHHVPMGTEDYFQGPQQLNAYALEHLFDRKQILGSYTDNGFIDRPLQFNRKEGRGINLRGNRTTSIMPNGAHAFSDDGEVWSSLDILKYLIANYYPAGLTFDLVGDYDTLDSVKEEWNFHGGTVFEAFNQLIDQKRGLGWRLYTTGSGDIYFYVFSTLAYPIAIGDAYCPANNDQVVVDFDGLIDVQPEITLNKLNNFDRVIVQGGPIRITGSWSIADGTLEPAWDPAYETTYKEASGSDNAAKDAERATVKHAQVYTSFRAPLNFDWLLGDGEGGSKYNAAPGYDYLANVDVDLTPNPWQDGVSFDHQLPIEEIQVDDQPVEYRKALVVVQNPDDDTWHLVNKLEPISKTSASVSVAHRSLTVYIRPTKANHIAALNHFDDSTYDTDIPPEYDYETYILTAQVETSARPTVVVSIPGMRATESGRDKVIMFPRAEVWMILPNTVTDVTDGALVKHADSYETVRDDTDSLRQIAVFALAWFCVARSQLSFTRQGLQATNLPGQLIRGYASNWSLTDVNTVITEQRMIYGSVPQTIWSTGYVELEMDKHLPGTRKMPQQDTSGMVQYDPKRGNEYNKGSYNYDRVNAAEDRRYALADRTEQKNKQMDRVGNAGNANRERAQRAQDRKSPGVDGSYKGNRGRRVDPRHASPYPMGRQSATGQQQSSPEKDQGNSYWDKARHDRSGNEIKQDGSKVPGQPNFNPMNPFDNAAKMAMNPQQNTQQQPNQTPMFNPQNPADRVASMAMNPQQPDQSQQEQYGGQLGASASPFDAAANMAINADKYKFPGPADQGGES